MADHEVNTNTNTNPLRNASPLPDSYSEGENQPVPVPSPVPVAAVTTLAVQRRYDTELVVFLQRFGLHSLLFLQFLWTFLSRAASTAHTVSMSVVHSLQPQLYVFFQGCVYPYNKAQMASLAGPGIPQIEWYYNADKKLFLSSNVYNSTNEYQTHHLEWLAAEVKYNDLVLYDVTDFIQQVKWAGAEKPNASLVLAAWSIHSGIVLNLREGLVLKTINEDGTESLLPLRG
jgi:hypothetical protein